MALAFVSALAPGETVRESLTRAFMTIPLALKGQTAQHLSAGARPAPSGGFLRLLLIPSLARILPWEDSCTARSLIAGFAGLSRLRPAGTPARVRGTGTGGDGRPAPPRRPTA